MDVLDKLLSIQKISKRMQMLLREVELAALDINEYSVPLSKGLFPSSWAKETTKALEDYTLEMQRITTSWKELFKEDIAVVEEVKPKIIKRRRRK